MTDSTSFPPSLWKLVQQLARLPSIGTKSAMRLAYHMLNNEPELIEALRESLLEAKEKIKHCQRCFFMTEEPICSICSNPNRDKALLCVVEKPADVLSIERSGEYRGVYHVLQGLWAPLRGKGPDSMRLKELIARVKDEGIREVILALNATVEGDATALYIAKSLAPLGVLSTRLAHGLPKGGELEFADDITLSHAFNGRRDVGL
ncbi:MAG: recombination mediator RecR [bacterium]|mgnify:CR=1 FL=1|nr:recombination mediator RecR [bacterium]